MKRREVLIIFLLAVLVTMGTAVLEMGERDYSDHEYGFPVDFLSIGWFFISEVDLLPFVSDVLFWFLVLAAGRWAIKRLKK